MMVAYFRQTPHQHRINSSSSVTCHNSSTTQLAHRQAAPSSSAKKSVRAQPEHTCSVKLTQAPEFEPTQPHRAQQTARYIAVLIQKLSQPDLTERNRQPGCCTDTYMQENLAHSGSPRNCRPSLLLGDTRRGFALFFCIPRFVVGCYPCSFLCTRYIKLLLVIGCIDRCFCGLGTLRFC